MSRLPALVLFLAIVGCKTKKESAFTAVSQKVASGTGEIVATLSCGEEIVRDDHSDRS